MKELLFGERRFHPEIRMLKDMREVLYDREFAISADDELPLYYMYRDVSRNENDEKKIKSTKLRYDITVIPPVKLGKEFVKTLGHYHPPLPCSDVTYAEVYEVLDGSAHYLLQKEVNGIIEDVVVIEAERGEKVIIPPNYGHVTINPSDRELKMANLVFREFSSIYEPIRRKKGAAYFELVDEGFIRNDNYEKLPDIRFLSPKDVDEIGLTGDRELYDVVINSDEHLDFLIDPRGFEWLFEKILR